MTTISVDPLTDDMLARFDQRTPAYDRENRFFDEDWEELVAAGYLRVPIPVDMGGLGYDLHQYSLLQRRLAYVAPADALAVNMHCYWMGLAADMVAQGDEAYRWMLEEGARGEVFCALHGEAGNDVNVLFAVTRADRVTGGWEITGHKIFGSLTPVWTYGGFSAMDSSNPDDLRIVHGFLPRSASGYTIVDTWDTLGMRATQSQDTLLEQAFVGDEHVPLVCPAGFAGAGPFHLALFSWALMGFASVYLGAARRAYDITVQAMPHKTSIGIPGGSMANHPEVQHLVADMRIALEASEAMIDRTCADWVAGNVGEDWPVKVIATRSFVIERAFEVVDKALDLSGGGGAFKRNRLEQLFRDIRMGRFHPGNTLMAHEVIGKLSLGVDPDSQPRWA